MAQTIENNAVIENNMIIANIVKEKVVLPWYKGEVSSSTGKGKAVFKKVAADRVKYFEGFDGLDKALKEASASGDDAKIEIAKTNLAEACKAFGEGGRLHELQTRTFALLQDAAKADPLGQTAISSLGVGLSVDDPSSFEIFKSSLLQAVIWGSRQVKNEEAQAKAKAEAASKAKTEVEALFEPLFEGEDLASWFDQKASDEAFLRAGKTLILRAQSVIRAELRTIDEQGSGSTARSQAIFDYVDEICSDMEQGLSDKAIHSKDRDGSKIWGQPSKLQIGTTARKILEACQVKLSALHSKADRTLSRLAAMQGAAKIVW